MNKKNKNKNRSKPTNPAPAPQKTETTQNVEEVIAVISEEKQESVVKESEPVIETPIELLSSQSVEESNKTPTDAPKKPKRNKGKKKKQDELSLDDNNTATNQDSISVLPPVADSEVNVQSENIEDVGETKVEEENKNTEDNITVNVRKKKNKKKQHEQQKPEEQTKESVSAEIIDSKNEESVIDKTIVDLNEHDITETDSKHAKKKNKKKKNRLDSEKSDKADEVVICTAAFQELVTSTENEGNINQETHIETSQDNDRSNKNLTMSVEEETLKDLIRSVLLPEESEQSQGEASQQDQVKESKNKKKAKKDKKQQHLKTDTEAKCSTEEKIILLEPTVVNPDIAQDLPLTEQMEFAVKDTSPKAKAKIAKPVEKKRRGKIDIFDDKEKKPVEENVSGDIDVKEPVPEIENISEHTCIKHISPDRNIEKLDQTLKTDHVDMFTATEKLPELLISPDIISPQIDTPISEINLNLSDANIEIKSSEIKTKPSDITLEPVPLKFEIDLEKSICVLSTALEVSEEKGIAITTEPYKTVEKKKRKHPKKIDVVEKSSETKTFVTPESESAKDKTIQQTEGSSTFSPSIDESVEISSLKPDEPVGPSDTTPDFIQHPLATSQQFVDDNNNTTIREITATDENSGLHLIIPAEPIIQNSGETPEPIGDKILKESPNLNKTRERSLTNEPEKTDLKSKMMEVSQDMEELRLSIERSLAELTSMERGKEDVIQGTEDIKAPVLVSLTPSEVKLCDIEVDKSEIPTNLCENILEKTISQESQNKSDMPIINTEPNTEKGVSSQAQIIEGVTSEVQVKPQCSEEQQTPPQAPVRKDNKGKGKGKRKSKQEAQSQPTSRVPETTSTSASENTNKDVKKEETEKQEQKSQASESNEKKGKQQQAMQLDNSCNLSEQAANNNITSNVIELSFDPIENFEDALTSSVDDVNTTFEMIANEVTNTPELSLQNPEINITSPTEETERTESKQNPVSPPKNLLGHPDIPVPSNRTDYKKEKNKPPNMRQAKVKIKDAVDIEKAEKTKQSRESQTETKRKIASNKNVLESFSYMTNEDAEYVYKYSFRKVFLQSLCHVCRRELGQRVPCQFCSLVFYCSQKHKDEDWPQHRALCFAICTIAHLKDQKHVYADAQNVTGQSYRLLRVQAIVSCERALRRRLEPWEQEALLYPRLCADAGCRRWRQAELRDCGGCGQVSHCAGRPEHLPAAHARWCPSYALYGRLVQHQQTRGRLEPKLPTGVVSDGFVMPEKINEVLAAIYDEKIDMTDVEYAALTQLATAPLTAALGYQLAMANHSNGISKKTSLTVHALGAELQFEADVLFKWELFFLHLAPRARDLTVVFISPDLNPSNLPLNLLEKLKLCDRCRADNRRVQFSFQDKKTYHDYWTGDEFCSPDIVCAFNPSVHRSSTYKGADPWPAAIGCILKLKTPFIVSSYSMAELARDVARVQECGARGGAGCRALAGPRRNPFAGARPDRNFVTDDEVPLLFKNYCFVVLCGV